MEISDFVRDKLTKWGFSEFIHRFEEEGIDKETFLSLEESRNISVLIPKIGPRAKFRKRLREYLQEPTIFPSASTWESASASDKDSGNEMGGEPIYPGATATQAQGLIAVILFSLRHHLTAAAQSDLMTLLNFLMPNLAAALEHLSDKMPGLSTVFYCQNCQSYMGENPDDCSCFHRGAMFNKVSSAENGRFFLSASLKDLLEDTLKNHGTELLPKTRVKGKHDIEGLDGIVCQRHLQDELAPTDLTLTFNCQDVPIFRSPAYSIWTIHFTINELPSTQRKENVLVAGFWFGAEKPRISTFIKPLVDECCDLAKGEFYWTDINGIVRSSEILSWQL